MRLAPCVPFVHPVSLRPIDPGFAARPVWPQPQAQPPQGVPAGQPVAHVQPPVPRNQQIRWPLGVQPPAPPLPPVGAQQPQ